MRRRRLLWQLYPSYLLLIVLALLAATWHASSSADRFYREQAARNMEVRARLVARHLSKTLSASAPRERVEPVCRELGQLTATRITVIRADGAVIGDSESDPEGMENHANRPEVREALAGRVGVSMRQSPTLGRQMIYVAVAMPSPDWRGTVVRTAMSLSYVDLAVRELQKRIAVAGLLIALFAAIVCLLVSRRIARPLEEMRQGVQRLAAGELGHRLHPPRTQEIASLAEVINQMAGQLEDRLRVITAQRNEQEAVFRSMVEGVLAVDMRERVLRMNQAAGALLHVSAETAQGKAIQEVVRNTDLQKFVALALASRDPVEGELRLHEGGERWLQATGAALHDAHGGQIGAAVVLNDVTRIRRLEQFRRDFVANVSHELRTPITCIKGFVETLLDGALREPEPAEKFLGIIAKQVDRLNAIISDLLLLSKIEQQGERGAIAAQEASLREVVDAAINVCQHKAQAKKIAIAVDCDRGLKARVNAPLLEQAVLNLVDNAIKYSEPGKSIHVSARTQEKRVFIEVRDEGCGIEKEHQPRIFERFYRVDKGRSRDMGGTGLGLAIVKHIAQAHGGSVEVESAAGRGSRFTINLPLT